MTTERDENLRPYATARQWEVLEAVWRSGGVVAAARELGIDHAVVSRQVSAVTAKAARAGYAPNYDYVHPVPDGFRLRGESILYGKDGEPKLRWVKSRVDEERARRLVEEAAAAVASDLPRARPVGLTAVEYPDQLLVGYPVGDLHLGMYAWHEETGEDYDLAIAERTVFGAVDHLVAAVPSAERALVAVLGDFFHYDSPVPVTPIAQNPLDSDSRYSKMVRVGIRTIRYVVRAALLRHREVHVIVEPGNHDPFSATFLREAMRAVYEHEPRVVIDPSPMNVHYHEFGANLVGVTHGHKVKLADLPLMMAADQPAAWGRTRHRTFWTGHIHQDRVVDVRGVRVESFRCLVAPEAYAHQAGYRPRRSLSALVLHRDHGEVARHTVSPEMLT